MSAGKTDQRVRLGLSGRSRCGGDHKDPDDCRGTADTTQDVHAARFGGGDRNPAPPPHQQRGCAKPQLQAQSVSLSLMAPTASLAFSPTSLTAALAWSVLPLFSRSS